MSNKQWQVVRTNVANLTDMVQQDVLAELTRTDPLMAKRLQQVNWEQVNNYVITEVVKELAEKNGHKFVSDVSEVCGRSGELKGEFLGAIKIDGNRSLAWTRDKTGLHCTEQAHGYDHNTNTGSAAVRKLQAQFDEVYRRHGVAAIAQLLASGQVKSEERDGEIIFHLEMEV